MVEDVRLRFVVLHVGTLGYTFQMKMKRRQMNIRLGLDLFYTIFVKLQFVNVYVARAFVESYWSHCV